MQIADDDPRQRAIRAGADPDEWSEGSADKVSDARYAVLEGRDVVAIATLAFVPLGGRVVVRVRQRPDGSRTMDG